MDKKNAEIRSHLKRERCQRIECEQALGKAEAAIRQRQFASTKLEAALPRIQELQQQNANLKETIGKHTIIHAS